MQAQGHYITGIDDDDEWTPNRLSVFLAHKHQSELRTPFCMPTTMCARARSTLSLPACRCIRNPLIRAAYSTSAILLAIRFLPGPGVLKRVCSIPNSRRRRTTTFFCAWWWSMANRGKSKRRRKFYISTTARCRLPLRRKKFSGYFHFYRKHKDKFDRASKKYQLFTLYQIRNKRMTWRTLLTLLSVRNSKRLAGRGVRGR